MTEQRFSARGQLGAVPELLDVDVVDKAQPDAGRQSSVEVFGPLLLAEIPSSI
jgi:hypothetical protein